MKSLYISGYFPGDGRVGPPVLCCVSEAVMSGVGPGVQGSKVHVGA